MKKLTVCFFVSMLCISVHAEIRIWRDKKGKEYEAEYVRELFDKVTLKTTDGKEHRLAVKDFSEHDQKYLRVMVPPNFSIDFSKKTSEKEKAWELWDEDDDVTTIVRGDVTIAKESKRPFTSSLKAEIFLVAEELDGENYILLGKTDSSFLFSEQNDYTHVFKIDPVEALVYLEFNFIQQRGEEYRGYLVVVSDAHGNILKTKTDIREWIEAPEVIENLRELMVRGKMSIRNRHFDKTGQKVRVPRPKFHVPSTR